MPMSPRLLRPIAPGGFNPKRLSGLAAWYDASVLSSVTITSGFVSGWSDLSGGGLSLTQGTEANRPGTGTLNGRQSVSFDGSNDFLANAGVPAGWLFGTFFVALAANSGGNLVTANVPSTTRRMSIGYSAVGNEFRTESRNASNATTGRSGGERTGSAQVLAYTFDGSSTAALRVSGQSQSGPTTFGGSGDDGITIGARVTSGSPTQTFNAEVGEFIIYNRVLSASEIGTVEQYLERKWGAT
jgi:hypothetical protein